MIDEETFRKLHMAMGEDDPNAMASLIQEYLGELPQLLEELHQAVAQDDSEKTRWVSHSMKSSSMLFGAIRLADLCEMIEIDALNEGLPRAPDLIAQAEIEFKAVQSALELKLR